MAGISEQFFNFLMSSFVLPRYPQSTILLDILHNKNSTKNTTLRDSYVPEQPTKGGHLSRFMRGSSGQDAKRQRDLGVVHLFPARDKKTARSDGPHHTHRGRQKGARVARWAGEEGLELYWIGNRSCPDKESCSLCALLEDNFIVQLVLDGERRDGCILFSEITTARCDGRKRKY